MPAWISREALERHQVWAYLAAVVVGLLIGTAVPGAAGPAETLVWPVLAVLLYATFAQMPLTALPAALKDARLLATALIGNFAVIPLLVWGLVQIVPPSEPLRLGLYLVLLVPCTDWFITFSHLGRGDASRATAFTPISLVLQLLLLPVYLWLLAGVDLSAIFAPEDVWPALLVVLVPLGLATGTQVWAKDQPRRRQAVARLGWWPVPVLALVIALVAISSVTTVRQNLHLLPIVVAVAVAYLAGALLLARVLANLARLPVASGRTLAFSLATRNSFIVLPFALSLPQGWEVAAIVVVMQSLVELLGMAFAVWFVPQVLFRAAPART